MPSPEKTSPSPALSFFTSSLNDLSAISACHQRENAKRAARSVADFERRRYHDRSRRGKLIEIFEALEAVARSEEHTSELQSLMRISYAVFCLKKKIITNKRCTTLIGQQIM